MGGRPAARTARTALHVLQGYTAFIGSVQLAPTWLLADGTNNEIVLLDFSEEAQDDLAEEDFYWYDEEDDSDEEDDWNQQPG